MNRKTLLTLVILLAVLGGAGLLLKSRNTATWQQQGAPAGGKILGDLPINDVARVVIKTADATLNLAKHDDVWRVQERNYPANFEQVSRVIRTLWELKAVQDVTAGPSQFARLELIEPAKDAKNPGTLVDLQDKDGKRIAALLLGKQFVKDQPGFPGGEGFPAGRYAMALDGKNRVALVSETFADIEPKPESWLDRAFIQIERIKTLALTGTAPAQQWKLTRDSENAEWKLDGAKPDEKLDTAKLPGIGSLASPSFTDVLAADAKPGDQPVTIAAETFDGFTYTLKSSVPADEKANVTVAVAATIDQERKPAADEKPEDKKRRDDEFAATKKQLDEKLAREKKLEGRVFVLPKHAIEPLLKDRASMIAVPPPTPTPMPAPAAAALPAGTPVEVVTQPVAAPAPAPKKRK
jgi:hypothetical protein